MIELQRIAVIGATGPTGIHLVREWVERGRPIVAVSRNRDRLEELYGDAEVEIATADALDARATREVVDGCDLVIDCIGLPPARMADHPRTAAVIARAAAETGARCLQISSYWSFFPNQGEVVSETHPRRGGHEWFRCRRAAEDSMLEAGAAVVHLPDFFGPEVHTSSVQQALREAVSAKPMSWMGTSDVAREVAHVPDAMRLVADLATHEEAYGTDWALPGNGALSGAGLAEIASQHLGRSVTLRPAPGWLLKGLSLVHPGLRAIRPMIPHYVRPVRYDTSKLEGLLDSARMRPLDEAIRATLDWLVAERDGEEPRPSHTGVAGSAAAR